MKIGRDIDLLILPMTLQIIIKLFDHCDSEHEEKRRDEGNEETDAQGWDYLRYCDPEEE